MVLLLDGGENGDVIVLWTPSSLVSLRTFLLTNHSLLDLVLFSFFLSFLPCFLGRVGQLENEVVYVINLPILMINFFCLQMKAYVSCLCLL